MLNKRNLAVVLAVLLSVPAAQAQIEGLTNETQYSVEMNGTTSDGDVAPFWFSSNKFGLSSVEPNSGYLRAGLWRSQETDSMLNWRYGYGLDVAVPVQYTSPVVIQQAYGIVQYLNAKLTIGAKEIPQDMLNSELSSGGMTLSNNYRPIPQVRFELPDWWHWHFTNDWVSVRGHIAYGMYTDWNWQKDFVATGERYTQKSLFHSKAGYMRIGRDDKSPLSGTIGIQFACQFGGYGYNIPDRSDTKTFFNDVNLGNGLKSFWHAFIPGGNDINDGDYNNTEGNHTGNWYFDLLYKGKDWKVKAYAEHYFEDHSQLFVQYGWKDMLWGLEVQLPKNPYVSEVVAEYLNTRNQTGGLYHDSNDVLPVQISGKDDYYNHQTYGAWQHWGQAVGNPLLVSPIYNNDGKLRFSANRVNAFHVGVKGEPTRWLGYRILYSHVKTWGTYDLPTLSVKHQDYLLTELSLKSQKKLKGWSATMAFGANYGDIINDSKGISLSIKKQGLLF